MKSGWMVVYCFIAYTILPDSATLRQADGVNALVSCRGCLATDALISVLKIGENVVK